MSQPVRYEWVDPYATPLVVGPPITNAAGDPFDPLPEANFSNPVLVFSRTEAAFDEIKAATYTDAMNKDVFLGYDPEQVQCLGIRAKAVWKGKTRFWRVTYRFRFKVYPPYSWQPHVLQAGFREFVAGNLVDITDPLSHAQVSSPQPLNDNGTAMSAANVRAGKAKYRKLSVYNVVNFADLHIAI